jgi:hypothetical protein
MIKPLDGFVIKKLKEYGFDQSAVWDCHGTWVVLHKVLEQIAAKEGIVFQQPFVCSADLGNIALCVTGELKDHFEWSIGESNPKNNRNPYPWAMAEKRGKDRVILKLIGLHGFVYSEDEADDFRDDKNKPAVPERKEPDKADREHPDVKGNVTKAKEMFKDWCLNLAACDDDSSLDAFIIGFQKMTERFKDVIPEWAEGDTGVDARITKRKQEISNGSS